MYVPKPLTIGDFKAEKRILEEISVNDINFNVWKGLAIWINTFASEYAKRGFFDILSECYQREIIWGGGEC